MSRPMTFAPLWSPRDVLCPGLVISSGDPRLTAQRDALLPHYDTHMNIADLDVSDLARLVYISSDTRLHKERTKNFVSLTLIIESSLQNH